MEKLELQQEQSDEAMQEEICRRVNEALAQARAQWEAEAAQAEAERMRLAEMNESERADYQLKRREEALAERERRLMERELRAMAVEKLAERGLPSLLADALPYADEAVCLAAMDAVEQAFRAAVQTAVEERLRGELPTVGAVRAIDMQQMSDEDYYRQFHAQRA